MGLGRRECHPSLCRHYLDLISRGFDWALPPPATIMINDMPALVSGTVASTAESLRNLNSTGVFDAELKVTVWKHSFVPKFSPEITTLSPGLTSSGSTLAIRGRLLRSQTGSRSTLAASNPLMDSVSKREKPLPSTTAPS